MFPISLRTWFKFFQEQELSRFSLHRGVLHGSVVYLAVVLCTKCNSPASVAYLAFIPLWAPYYHHSTSLWSNLFVMDSPCLTWTVRDNSLPAFRFSKSSLNTFLQLFPVCPTIHSMTQHWISRQESLRYSACTHEQQLQSHSLQLAVLYPWWVVRVIHKMAAHITWNHITALAWRFQRSWSGHGRPIFFVYPQMKHSSSQICFIVRGLAWNIRCRLDNSFIGGWSEHQ